MEKFYTGMAEILEVDGTVGPDVRLDDGVLAWDSLAVVSTIALIDELFGKTVDGQALTNCKSIGEIENLISQA